MAIEGNVISLIWRSLSLKYRYLSVSLAGGGGWQRTSRTNNVGINSMLIQNLFVCLLKICQAPNPKVITLTITINKVAVQVEKEGHVPEHKPSWDTEYNAIEVRLNSHDKLVKFLVADGSIMLQVPNIP